MAIEGAKFIVPLSREQKKTFDDKVREYAAERHWTSVQGGILICCFL